MSSLLVIGDAHHVQYMYAYLGMYSDHVIPRRFHMKSQRRQVAQIQYAPIYSFTHSAQPTNATQRQHLPECEIDMHSMLALHAQLMKIEVEVHATTAEACSMIYHHMCSHKSSV